MSKAVLVRKSDHAVVGGVIDTSRAQWIVDPDTRQKLASPAMPGWENDKYQLCAFVEAAPVPKGKRRVGPPERVFDSKTGKVIESVIVDDQPVERMLTDSERLERVTGLTIAQIKVVLA